MHDSFDAQEIAKLAEEAVRAGFSPERGDRTFRCRTLMIELIAAAALVVSLGVAGTAVSIGLARAVPAAGVIGTTG